MFKSSPHRLAGHLAAAKSKRTPPHLRAHQARLAATPASTMAAPPMKPMQPASPIYGPHITDSSDQPDPGDKYQDSPPIQTAGFTGGSMSKAHPGFAAVQSKIQGEGYSKKAAGAILANATRKASPAAKKRNPRLNRVKGNPIYG